MTLFESVVQSKAPFLTKVFSKFPIVKLVNSVELPIAIQLNLEIPIVLIERLKVVLHDKAVVLVLHLSRAIPANVPTQTQCDKDHTDDENVTPRRLLEPLVVNPWPWKSAGVFCG